MDQEERLINYCESMEGNSLIDALCSIDELAGDDEYIKNLLVSELFQSPPKGIHNKINIMHQNVLNASKKRDWVCGHDGCENSCIDSHELSKGAVLMQWSHKDHEDNTNKVGMIRVDQQNNSLGYVYKNIPISKATVFPGYCKQHDEELFIELDGFNQDIDEHYVNLQALRILKSERFNLSRNVRINEDYIVALKNLLLENKNHNEFSVYIKERIQSLEEKRSGALSNLKIMEIVYCKLWDGICNKEYIVKYARKTCDISGWGFSCAYLCSNSSVDFLFKVDINSQPILVYAWSQSESLAESEQLSEVGIASYIMKNKNKLVFSKEFWEKTDAFFRKIILDNDDFSGLSQKPMGIVPCIHYLFGK